MTDQEQARYRVYVRIMGWFDLQPRGLKDWLVTYHQMMRRAARRRRLNSESYTK